MRIHALEATGGKTYAQMPQYATADGKGTNDAAQALKDPKTGAPVSNPARQVWINETALSTALNTSFFAASVGMFAIVMGIALLLIGIGFLVLASASSAPPACARSPAATCRSAAQRPRASDRPRPLPRQPRRAHPGGGAFAAPVAAAIDLYWIPLGAGGHSVRLNGRVFEAIAAASASAACDLYHAALVVHLDGERYTIELAPSPDADGASRGVVGTGPSGRRLGWSRWFRYELRCWRGCIPDLGAASAGPGGRGRPAERPACSTSPPRPAGAGRDEPRTGEMWNSNSLTAWLIAAAGLPTDELRPPPGGRAGLVRGAGSRPPRR